MAHVLISMAGIGKWGGDKQPEYFASPQLDVRFNTFGSGQEAMGATSPYAAAG